MSPPLSACDRDQLARNLAALRARLASACAAAGREAESVRLVAVSKYTGPALARALAELGQRDLGENRVAHLRELDQAFDPGERPRWHMIGHLQRNKADHVADLLSELHSLDSLKLARRLDGKRDPSLPPLRVCVQVCLDPESPQRSGLDAGELPAFVDALGEFPRLECTGLMGLPPLGSPEEARPHFQHLARLLAGLLAEKKALGSELSMGMSSDLEVAIAEGATVVRVGRALLEGLSPQALEA